MKLIPEWKRVLRKAWSIKFVVLSGLCSGIEVALPVFQDAVPRGIFAGLTVFFAISALVSRVVIQPKLRDGD